MAFHLFLKNGVQIRGIVQGVQILEGSVVKGQILPAVLVIVFVKLFQSLFRGLLEEPFIQKFVHGLDGLLPLLRSGGWNGCRTRHSGNQKSRRQKKSGKDFVHSTTLPDKKSLASYK